MFLQARVEAMAQPVASTQPPESILNLRSRAADVRAKMDHHKILLDRYLPVPGAPMNSVEYEVEDKYSELAARYGR